MNWQDHFWYGKLLRKSVLDLICRTALGLSSSRGASIVLLSLSPFLYKLIEWNYCKSGPRYINLNGDGLRDKLHLALPQKELLTPWMQVGSLVLPRPLHSTARLFAETTNHHIWTDFYRHKACYTIEYSTTPRNIERIIELFRESISSTGIYF